MTAGLLRKHGGVVFVMAALLCGQAQAGRCAQRARQRLSLGFISSTRLRPQSRMTLASKALSNDVQNQMRDLQKRKKARDVPSDAPETEKEEDVVPPLVAVLGATGGVGGACVRELKSVPGAFRVRAVVRNKFGNNMNRVTDYLTPADSIVEADVTKPVTLKEALSGADYVICAAAAGVSELQPQANPVEVADSILFGGFEKVDNRGVANVAAVAAGLDIPPKRIILVSSLGVTRFPVVQLASLAGDVLAQKRKGEMALITSGLPYTIVRPGRLQGDGGPEQPESVKQEKLRLGQGDIMSPGRISRMDVAKACVEILKRPSAATDSTFEIVGDASDMTSDKWDEVFASLKTDSEYKSPIEEVLGFDPFEPSSVLKRIVEILPPPPSSP
eukprot:CAMPEP_0167758550 /NCGR_PEP_ID=MMETSP0110_2-20121227/10529_1 /TAXON_ID=629695 /ORGANISM="Gymnochlora sp., Strain CCMP2014" /LENGTH=387 /DNA_ID=CAMNT_0007644835 /DNA_START=209 /DNA_END=1372 /DNA_ORIENTATION=-